MERFLCIHGHFYQPPRENPWLEAVEIQDGAFPYHDWNERITAECYAPNVSSRILDSEGRIMDIASNYARISFNVGPTLMSWLERCAPETYQGILDADRLSISWRSGHGAAIAQAYNHTIMPLSSARDKSTQCIWGIRDFRYRFGREPEGMWLPETAVDLETLDVLASQGIKFTILAPHQARQVRRKDSEHWEDVSGEKIDPRRAYTCRLPSGREMSLFFYDGPISRAVAFEGLLKSGEEFAHRLLDGFSEQTDSPQLVNIATDGESYGHHHRFGDMALAYALDYIARNGLARITNYAEFLEIRPPEEEVEIFENTSWSCAHGIEHWRSDCGCSSGANPGWSQKWRAPLRESLDWLRDRLAGDYSERAAEYFSDPWAARDDYIDVILHRSSADLEEFLLRRARAALGPEERVRAVKLLEVQRHAMLMYTSCGWFFDDLAGMETLQVMQYAGRALQLAQEFSSRPLEDEFIGRLEAARSNIPSEGSGADIYGRRIKPYMLDLLKVAAHYAISSLFNDYAEETNIYCYGISSEDYRKRQSGRTGVVAGRCRVVSHVTGESGTVSYGVLHLGEHDFNCGVRVCSGEAPCEEMADEIVSTFESGAFSELVRLIDQYFGADRYTLWSLFRDEQRGIFDTLIKETMDAFENSYRRLYEDNRILMAFLKDAGIPLSRAFLTAVEFTLNLDLKRMLMSGPEAAGIREILEEFGKWKIPPDAVVLEFTFRRTLEREMERLLSAPSDLPLLTNMERIVDIALSLPFDLNLWTTQNIYFRIAKDFYPDMASKAAGGGEEAAWVESFRALGQKLNFTLEAVLEGVKDG